MSPIAPVVLQPSPANANATAIHNTPALAPEGIDFASPAPALHSPLSAASLQSEAADTVYRLHRVSPYRYVETPQPSRCVVHMRPFARVQLTHSCSVSVGHSSAQAAVGQARFVIDAQQLHSRFDDEAASPVDFNRNTPSPDATARGSSPIVSDAFEPAIFSFSANRPSSDSAIRTGQESLLSRSRSHDLGETMNNLIMNARARRRVLAQQMQHRLCLRTLYSIMHEWQHIVIIADATDGMHCVRRQLVAQRCCICSRVVSSFKWFVYARLLAYFTFFVAMFIV